jgi:hypothetical protein
MSILRGASSKDLSLESANSPCTHSCEHYEIHSTARRTIGSASRSAPAEEAPTQQRSAQNDVGWGIRHTQR